jgi:hypothetical protein
MIHTLGVLFILYSIAYYFYLSGQYSKNESNLYGLLIDYWESERNIQKLEKYININLDKLITSKGYSHEENIINTKKNNIVVLRIISIGFIILLVHILLMLKKNQVFNCDYLNEGIIIHKDSLNNIDDDKFCKMPKPKGFCYMKALTGFFDKYTNMNDCILNKNIEKKNFINSLSNQYQNTKISENTNIFGYPLTNNKNYYFNDIDNNENIKFEEAINKEIYDINKFPNNKHEVTLDYSDNKNPKLNINLLYNKQLSEERKGKESKDSLFKNVFVIYLSGVSQFYFKNVLPKLSSFIQRFAINRPEENQLSLNSYQFTRYHSFSNDSFSNYFLMFYDSSINSLKDIKTKLNGKTSLNINDHLEYFKENGYITGQSTDTCKNYDHLINNIFWDHENMAISCDVNYLDNIKNNNYCLYGNPIYTYHINYAMQFWKKYKDNRKYFRLNFNSVSENEDSLLSYLDEPLNDLFIQLSFNGLLDDTAIFFVSENGRGYDKILYDLGIHNEKEINMKFGSFILLLNKNNKLNIEDIKMKAINYYSQTTNPYDILDNFNLEIEVKNGAIKFHGKEKEFNMNYELNNNEEIDNGMLINSKDELVLQEPNQDNNEEQLENYVKNNNSSKNIIRSQNIHRPSSPYKQPPINNYIVKMVSEFGYGEDYVIKSLEKNELNHATTIYYLLSNYENIK